MHIKCEYILLYPRVFSLRISVRPFVCSFVRNSVTTTKVLVNVSPMVYISVTDDQKAFIFGP